MPPKPTILSKPFPLGEEIWVRRDLENRGGSFIFRELVIISILCWQAFILLLLPSIIVILFQTSDLALQLAMAACTVVILISACISFFFLARLLLHMSHFSPTWLYAEQLNPETLTIHRLRKQPTQLQLAESTIQSRTFLKHYTTITITDKENNSATLPALTPEETDRFMAYWNAANPPSKAPE